MQIPNDLWKCCFTIKCRFLNLISSARFCSSFIFIFSVIRTLDYPDYFMWSQRVRIIEVRLYCALTYSLIALMKLDFPEPSSPVIATFTSTSRHLSSLLCKISLMLETPLTSISFWSSFILIFAKSSSKHSGAKSSMARHKTNNTVEPNEHGS